MEAFQMIKNFYSRSIFFIALFLTIQTAQSMWLATAAVGGILNMAFSHIEQTNRANKFPYDYKTGFTAFKTLNQQNPNIIIKTQLLAPLGNTAHIFAADYTCKIPSKYFNHPNFRILSSLKTKALHTLLRNTNKEEINNLELVLPQEIEIARKKALFNKAMKTRFSKTTYTHIIKDLAQNDTSLLEILLAEPKFNKGTACLINTLLYRAVRKGDVKLLQFLIKHKANINIKSPVSKINLQHIAAIFKQEECKKILLDSGLSLNHRIFPENYSAQDLWDNPNLITDELLRTIITVLSEIKTVSQ